MAKLSTKEFHGYLEEDLSCGETPQKTVFARSKSHKEIPKSDSSVGKMLPKSKRNK